MDKKLKKLFPDAVVEEAISILAFRVPEVDDRSREEKQRETSSGTRL